MEVRAIMIQNPWWKHGTGFSEHDPSLSKQMEIEYKRSPIDFKTGSIYIIKGPRQIGKTFWIKRTIKNLLDTKKVDPKQILYLSCDSFVSRRELRNAISFFLDYSRGFEKVYMFLDEITFLQNWNDELKHMADTGQLTKRIIVATGSSPVIIEKGGYLPGRGMEGNGFLLQPLSFREFILQTTEALIPHIKDIKLRRGIDQMLKKLKNTSIDLNVEIDKIRNVAHEILPFQEEINYLFEVYLHTGGFPFSINNYLKNNTKKIDEEIYERIIRYILGDISKHGRKESTARQCLEEVSKRIGGRYSFINLSKDLEASHITIIEYIDIMEKSFIIQVLHPYDFNKKTPRPKANKKIFFSDPLIYYSTRSWLLGQNGFELTEDFLIEETNQGKIIESIVASHLAKTKEQPYIKEPITFLWYWYNRGEIDFIYKKNNTKYLGIEVKYQKTTSPKDILKINQITQYILLSKDNFDYKENTLIIPTSTFLALLKQSEKNL